MKTYRHYSDEISDLKLQLKKCKNKHDRVKDNCMRTRKRNRNDKIIITTILVINVLIDIYIFTKLL